MADPEQPNSGATQPNGAAEPAAKPTSLRDIAEAAYDELIDGADAPEGEPAPSEPPAQPRDERGRYASKDAATGEQPATAPTQPRENEGQQPEGPTQPAAAVSSEPPANWSAADRETFARLAPEGREFLLRRHSEMEGDYQRRVQANARAAEFTSALEPVFRDPVIAGSLQQSGASPLQAISEWAGFHRRAMSPNVDDKVHLLFELAARMQIDPAVFAPSPSGPQGQPPLSEADLKDPAIRFFADHIGRTSNEVQSLRQQLISMQQADANRQNAEAIKVSRWSIDSFADEKGADGKPLRPDFDQVIDQISQLLTANPNLDLREAYETARWMNPATRQTLVAAEKARVEQAEANKRAAQAVRSNTRGITSPVSKPADDPSKPKSLRDTIEEAAEEIGFLA
jgi:hypothetical protein